MSSRHSFAGSTVPGFPCPECGARIVATMDQLLAGSVRCGACALELTIDQERSAEAVAALAALKSKMSALE